MDWPAIEWNDDGYPVAEDSDYAEWRALPLNLFSAARFLVDALPAAARHCCCSCDVEDGADDMFGSRPVKRITFSTGGWSGAESLLGFIESRFDTSQMMLSWRRGGHYVFEVPTRLLTDQASA